MSTQAIIGAGVATLIAAYWLHRAKRTPLVGHYRLRWSDPTAWTPAVVLLYAAGAALVLGGALRGLL